MDKPVSGDKPLKTGRERKTNEGQPDNVSQSEPAGKIGAGHRMDVKNPERSGQPPQQQAAGKLDGNVALPDGRADSGSVIDPRNKRRRRRRKRKPSVMAAVASGGGQLDATSSDTSIGDLDAAPGSGKVFRETTETSSGQGLHSLPNEPVSAHLVDTDDQKVSQNKRRKRRRGGRKKPSVDMARNFRAPVQQTPDVKFVGGVASDGGPNGKSSNHNRQRQNNGLDGKPSNGHSSQRAVAWNETRYQKGTPLYAALDLGTNNCRLLVATATSYGRFRVVDGYSRIVRLGEGLGQSGRLSDGAMDRAVAALKVCAAKLGNPDIRSVRLIATEACRRAHNGEAFLARVLEETGLDLEIVDRETEARLAAEGCGALMDEAADGAVLFDIGGGSSELVLVNRKLSSSGAISKQIAAWTSLPLGVVTLAEHHGGQEVSRDIYAGMVAEVRSHIEAFEGRSNLSEIWAAGKVHLLGTSGTVTTLAGVHLNLPRYDRRKVDGIWLASSEIDAVIDSLLDMTFEERALSPCIGQERADLVLAGCAIFQAIREAWPAERLRVADRGLREGILTELMRADGAWQRRGNQNRGANKHPGRNRRRKAWRGNNKAQAGHDGPAGRGDKQ